MAEPPGAASTQFRESARTPPITDHAAFRRRAEPTLPPNILEQHTSRRASAGRRSRTARAASRRRAASEAPRRRSPAQGERAQVYRPRERAVRCLRSPRRPRSKDTSTFDCTGGSIFDLKVRHPCVRGAATRLPLHVGARVRRCERAVGAQSAASLTCTRAILDAPPTMRMRLPSRDRSAASASRRQRRRVERNAPVAIWP